MSNWPVTRLGEILRQRKEFITIDDEIFYRRCRVQVNARGIVLRDNAQGSEIKTKRQQLCHKDDFLVAEIDAKVGGYGVVPEELSDAIVSSHYFLFELDTSKIIPKFLDWFARTPEFFAQVAAQGSTNYAAIRPSNVLRYTIPLPPPEVQRGVVARLDGFADLLEARRQSILSAESELAALLSKTFERITDSAPKVALGEVAPIFRRPIDVQPDGSYLELGVRSFGRGLFDKPTLTGSDLTWQKLFQIREGDLVFSNIKAWEGAFAVARERHDGMVGSHRYLTCVPDRSRTTADFLWYVLQSREGLLQIQEASPGSADRNRTLSQKGLEATLVPLPSLQAQLWFDQLQAQANAIRVLHASADEDASALLPSLLDRVLSLRTMQTSAA